MAQQTALQQLIEWAVSLKNNSQQCTDWICIREKAEELLQIEKEQSKQDYDAGLFDGTMDDVKDRLYKNAEQYYNENYNQNES